jgi:RNA polymerase subunit RPABC4/transcription elongation factor Spt4
MNPSNVFCDNCGAANEPQAKFCHVCGNPISVPTPVAQVERPLMTNHQGYSCPRCGTSEYVKKVSSIVGTAPAGGIAGPLSGNTNQTDIRRKLALPPAPIYKSPWNCSYIFIFGLVLLVVLICAIGISSWLQALLKTPNDSGVLGTLIGLTLFTLPWLGLAIFIFGSRRYIARERRAKVAAWQSVRTRWEQTYYCARDDIVFLPGEQGTYKPASELSWFLQQTPM